MALRVDDGLVIPDAELQWRFTPSGGPGGQHANRSNTRVELTWHLSDSAVVVGQRRHLLLQRLGPVVTVSVDDERSQLRNRQLAADRLVDRVRQALVVDKPRRATKPSRGAKERRLRDKRSRSRNKELRRRPGSDD
jgi:ribosome-associated protein